MSFKKKAKWFLFDIIFALVLVSAGVQYLEDSAKIPIVEMTLRGTCIRVVNGFGVVIPDGCEDIKTFVTYKQRYR